MKMIRSTPVEAVRKPPKNACIIGSLKQDVFAVSLMNNLTVWRSTWIPYKQFNFETADEWIKMWEMTDLGSKPCPRRACNYECVFAGAMADNHLWILVCSQTGPRLFVLDLWGGTVQIAEVQTQSSTKLDVCANCLGSELQPIESGFLVTPNIKGVMDYPMIPLSRLSFRDGNVFLEPLLGIGSVPRGRFICSNVGIVPDSDHLIVWMGENELRLNDSQQSLVLMRSTEDINFNSIRQVVFLRRRRLQCLLDFFDTVCCFDVSIEFSENGLMEAVLRPVSPIIPLYCEFLLATPEDLLYRKINTRGILRHIWPDISPPSLFDASFFALKKEVREKFRFGEMKLISGALTLVPFRTTIIQRLIQKIKAAESDSDSMK